MFLGEYQHSLDSKGRLVLPRKFRDELEHGLVVTIGQENCLYVFSIGRWQEEVARVNRLPRTDGRARKLARSFFAAASDQHLDKQGRVQLTDKLRGFASLDKDVTVVGVSDRIEIWATDVWTTVQAEADEFYAGIEEVLSAEGGI
ncbi:MAG: division/cell wall cluster transcriptional repressor MraZ [Acidimicrobiia bacterium]